MNPGSKKIIFYEVFDEERDALKKYLTQGIEADFFKETIQESGHANAPAQVISIRTQSKIPVEWSNDLKGILTRSTGYEHILSYCLKAKSDISCGHLPSYCARAVAEQAIVMLLALWRKLPAQMENLKTFSRDGLTGQEFLGKSLLIVGVGRIGKECAAIADALGMRVKGVDIDPREKSVEYVSFDDGMRWADAVISAVPLTDKTAALFSLTAFRKMRTGGVFVNVSRGEVSPLGDLRKALEEGLLSGLGLDVYEKEANIAEELRRKKGGAGSEAAEALGNIVRKKNVILTPHNAFNTQQALERKAKQTMASVQCFFETGRFLEPIPGMEKDKE